MKKLPLILFFSAFLYSLSIAQIEVNTTMSNDELVQTLAGSGVTISNVAITAAPGSFGFFSGGNVGQKNINLAQGVLLTSGSAMEVVGPNNYSGESTINWTPGHPLLNSLGLGNTSDAAVIEFDVTITGTTLAFEYVFGSEEYHEFVGPSFNYKDVFGLFISGPGISGSQNIAFIPNTIIPVSINNVNNGYAANCPSTGINSSFPQFFVDNCGGTNLEYDGFTTVFTARSFGLTPCSTYHITMAIADVRDRQWDSGVFIAGGSLRSRGGTDFLVTPNCNGNWSVTATAADQTVTNNRWELWTTNIEGATAGGTLVSTINGGLSATFSWLDLSKFYYIRHVSTVCGQDWETVHVVPDFSGTANADFILEDANGTEKDIFCFGEDIYFDGTTSFNYDRFYINSRRRPAGSDQNVPFDHHAYYGWTMSNAMGVFNLSQAFENLSLTAFEPGFEYEIQLAIMNLGNCVPWVETRRTFTVVCCDGYLNANFRELLEDNGGNTSFSLKAVDFESYGASIVHEWLIYSSQSWNSGPYTLVHQTTTTGAGPVELYDQGQYGRFYFIVHRLLTACGELCFGQFVEGTILTFATAPTNGNIDCELCGPIDCDVVNELCVAPDGEYTYCGAFPSNSVVFNWNPVQNATQYRVQLLLNDPSCCGEGTQSSQTYTIYTPYFLWEGMARSCFSWRVGAVCEGQTIWSEYHCFSGCDALLPGNIEAGLVQPGTDASKTPAQQPLIYPNPANDELNIAFPLEVKADLVKIVDLQGKVIFELRAPEQHLKIDSSKFIAGMYAIQVIYSDGSQSVEQIVITH